MTLPTSTLKNILIVITILAVVAMGIVAPIPQDVAFHQFVDQRTWLSIPNYWNVLTNVGFLWVGISGLYQLLVTHQLRTIPELTVNYGAFFLGVTMVAVGSSYYHWYPNNHTLIWDRWPMTIAFMALLSIAFGEFLSLSWGRKSFWPLIIVGLTSVFYWYWGELHGVGDLRLYVLVQYLPMLILPILFIFGKPVFNNSWGYWSLLAVYILAKLAEHFDVKIYQLTNGFIGGHAIKHVLVVIGLYLLLLYFKKRNKL